jgi:RHS repeat-associated protein
MWHEEHYPFGASIEEGSTTMVAGAGDYQVEWVPHFRFPGQYEDDSMGISATGESFFVQNHYREYMPMLGRYNRVDPFIPTYLFKEPPKNTRYFTNLAPTYSVFSRFPLILNPYKYGLDNPIINPDPKGLLTCGCKWYKCWEQDWDRTIGCLSNNSPGIIGFGLSCVAAVTTGCSSGVGCAVALAAVAGTCGSSGALLGMCDIGGWKCCLGPRPKGFSPMGAAGPVPFN